MPSDNVFVVRGEYDKTAGSLSINQASHASQTNEFACAIPAYANSPQYKEIKVEASQGNPTEKSMQRGRAYLPESPETLTYTARGNLASDSRWVYTWNSEQMLVQMQTSANAITAGAPNEKYVYSYDWRNRKTKAEKYLGIADGNSTTWVLQSTNHRYYDEWNLIYEETIYSSIEKDFYGFPMMPSVKKYYYGTDLMKSLHATGGAGGLLMVEIDGAKGYVYTNANGNVEAIYSADVSAELLAEYEYSAFGETRKQSGALAEKNPLRYTWNTRQRLAEIETSSQISSPRFR